MARARRAICEPLRKRTVIATASLCSVLQTPHNDTVAIAVRRRNGSQTARATHHVNTKNWRSHGVREACDS
eukprot:11170490-Lingulodinium_polyedra.AAC.1